MELQSPFDDGAEIDGLLLRRGWPRKFQQILYDPRSASRLPVRQVQLALHGIVEPFALAHQFRDAQNRRQRIIQFMSHAGEHLSHCCELFGLNQLFFEALQICHVSPRKNHAIDLSFFVEEWTEVEKDFTPLAQLVPHSHFEGCKILSAADDVVVERHQFWEILGVGVGSKLHFANLVASVTQHFAAPRTDECVTRFNVKNENQIRKAVDEPARKFLLFVQPAFNFAAFGNIHQRALITDDLPGGVANGGGGVQTRDENAVLAQKSDFAARQHRLAVDFLPNNGS